MVFLLMFEHFAAHRTLWNMSWHWRFLVPTEHLQSSLVWTRSNGASESVFHGSSSQRLLSHSVVWRFFFPVIEDLLFPYPNWKRRWLSDFGGLSLCSSCLLGEPQLQLSPQATLHSGLLRIRSWQLNVQHPEISSGSPGRQVFLLQNAQGRHRFFGLKHRRLKIIEACVCDFSWMPTHSQ